MLSVIIDFLIVGFWLIWNSFLILYTLKFEQSFNYIILRRAQLVKYWVYILTLLVMLSYIFLLRLNNVNRSINIYDLGESFCNLLSYLSLVEIIVLAIIILLSTVFVFLLLKLIYLHLRKCLLSLFLYYYQYPFFRNCCYTYISLALDATLYLITRVHIFTTNKSILRLAHYLWPGFRTWIEPKIFRWLLPYLCIFDILTQNGNISKLFVVLPWYYIYMLVRLSFRFFREIFTPENTQFTRSVYKSVTVNGKTIRWVELPEIK